MTTITIAGKIVASPRTNPFWGCITIDLENGLINSVEEGVRENTDYTFGDDCLVFPGFGDVHIHAREDETIGQNYKEEYRTAAEAAINGGVVHISAMPNTPNPVRGETELTWHRNRVQEIRHPCTILNYLGVDRNTRPLGRPGDYLYKLYFGKSVGDLTVTFGDELDAILSRYREQYVSFHVEYEPVVQMHAHGATHSQRRPVQCVTDGLRILLPLIERYSIRAKLCHWSTGGDSFRMIREYRDRGCSIQLEVSPLHLIFDTSMTDTDPSLWTKVQMNPAIQSLEHRRDLIEGLRSGFIDMLATDHAPHTEEEKFAAFKKFADRHPGKTSKAIAALVCEADPNLYRATCCENNTSGAPWLDTYGMVCAFLMGEHGFTPADIARVASYNPGQFVNRFLPLQFPGRDFGKGFGEIAQGFVGSLTVLNMAKQTVVDRKNLKTKVGWSPLEGMSVLGGVEAVFVQGRRVK